MNRRNSKRMIFYVLITVAIIVMAMTVLNPFSGQEYENFGELINDIKAGNVTELVLNDSGKCTVKNAAGETKTYKFTNIGYNFFQNHYGDLLQEQ